jgi:uncharacterized protein (DUF952 family)
MEKLEKIFHVTRAVDWREADSRGGYHVSTRDRTLEEEGFIHCSFEQQVAYVVATYFRDVDDELVVLVIDRQRVSAEVRVESAGGDEWFPHMYGPLNLDAVIDVRPVER